MPRTSFDRRVAAGTATDLMRAAHDLACSTSEPGLDRAERLARAGHAANRARDVTTVADWLNPYSGRSGDVALLEDLQLVARADRQLARGPEVDDANERLALHREWRQLRAAVEVPGLQPTYVVDAGSPAAVETALWLNRYASRVTGQVGPADELPVSWGTLPPATVDPGPDNPLQMVGGTLDSVPVPWRVAAIGMNVSTQAVDWTGTAGAREFQAFGEATVDASLEKVLLETVLAAAPAAADLPAAESAVGVVWPTGPNLVLVNGVDRPAVVRLYAADNLLPGDRPEILATGGVPAGVALVMATGAIHLNATAHEWTPDPEPKVLGTVLICSRAGRAAVRIPGAAQKVVLG